MKTKYILSLSGNDIFSGGGLSADLAAYHFNGLHGFVAVTCLTALTDKGFEVMPVDKNLFAQQLDSLKEVPFAAIKLGLLPNVAVAQEALAFVKTHQQLPIVLDPVLVCKENHDLEVSALRDELIQFFPYVSIITPNLVEAQILSGQAIDDFETMKQAAQKLYDLGAKTIVIKGGNRFDDHKAVDLFYDGDSFEVLETPVLTKNNTGAGCTFAASIASALAKGETTLQAVFMAKDKVFHAIESSDDYGVRLGDD